MNNKYVRPYIVKKYGNVFIISNAHLRMDKSENYIIFSIDMNEIKNIVKRYSDKDFALRVLVRMKKFSAMYQWAINAPTNEARDARLHCLNRGINTSRIINMVCQDIKSKLGE